MYFQYPTDHRTLSSIILKIKNNMTYIERIYDEDNQIKIFDNFKVKASMQSMGNITVL